MIELLSFSVLLLAVGCLIFATIILPNMEYFFEYMKYYFDALVYFKLSAVYIGVLFAAYMVLICRFVSKTPVELIKEV